MAGGLLRRLSRSPCSFKVCVASPLFLLSSSVCYPLGLILYPQRCSAGLWIGLLALLCTFSRISFCLTHMAYSYCARSRRVTRPKARTSSAKMARVCRDFVVCSVDHALQSLAFDLGYLVYLSWIFFGNWSPTIPWVTDELSQSVLAYKHASLDRSACYPSTTVA